MARPDAVTRCRLALERRVYGDSYEQAAAWMREHVSGIGAAYTAQRCADDVEAGLRVAQTLLAGSDSTDSKDLARLLELTRLDGYQREAQRLLDDSIAEGERLDALRSIDRLLRIGARRDALLALSSEAAVPPSPEADDVDELRAKREQRMQERAAGRA